MHIPEFMPVLKEGCHDDPENGACVMEYISFITQPEKFTDTPNCTPVALAHLAWMANDYQPSDALRSERMVPLMPRLIGAGRNREFDQFLSEYLYGLAMVSTAPLHQYLFITGVPKVERGDGGHQDALKTHNVGQLVKYIRDPNAEGSAEWLVETLVDALDLYDKFLGRDKTENLTEKQTESALRLHSLIGG